MYQFSSTAKSFFDDVFWIKKGGHGWDKSREFFFSSFWSCFDTLVCRKTFLQNQCSACSKKVENHWSKITLWSHFQRRRRSVPRLRDWRVAEQEPDHGPHVRKVVLRHLLHQGREQEEGGKDQMRIVILIDWQNSFDPFELFYW